MGYGLELGERAQVRPWVRVKSDSPPCLGGGEGHIWEGKSDSISIGHSFPTIGQSTFRPSVRTHTHSYWF